MVGVYVYKKWTAICACYKQWTVIHSWPVGRAPDAAENVIA